MNITQKEYNWKNQSLFSLNQFYEHLKLYAGYVNRSNEYAGRCSKNCFTPVWFETKTKETFDLDGVILHELFFDNIASKKPFNFYDIGYILIGFKDYTSWEDDFKRCALMAKGWVIFGYEPFTQTYRNIILDAHNEGLVLGFKPLLVLDMYEHAYFIDFGVNKEQYINDFITNINWKVVEERQGKI